MEHLPKIVSVVAVGPGLLEVVFNNGVKKRYDCTALLKREEFALLRTPAFFKAVQVDAGGYGVFWNDDLDLAEYELWTRGETVAGEASQKAS